MPRQGLIAYIDPQQQESKQVLELLRAERCHFITRDVTESGMAEMELSVIFGKVTTPVVVWEGHTVHGFDQTALRNLFDRQSS